MTTKPTCEQVWTCVLTHKGGYTQLALTCCGTLLSSSSCSLSRVRPAPLVLVVLKVLKALAVNLALLGPPGLLVLP